jgi:hypothetical protein
MTIALQLAKSGWWEGDPGRILKAPASEVMAAAQFENFLPEYERAVIDLNREKN